MNLRTRLIAPLLQTTSTEKDLFDVDALIKRLSLFETYIIDSKNLQEIPFLIRTFGFDGLIEIFKAGFLKLNSLVMTTGSLGPTLFVGEAPTDKTRPLFHYSFAKVNTGDMHHNLNLAFQRIEPEMDLSSRQYVRLRRTIYSALEKPLDKELGTLDSTKNDLLHSPKLLLLALSIATQKHLNIKIDQQAIDVELEYDSENDFHVKSNLGKLLSVEPQKTHKIIETACLAIAKRNDRIGQMQNFSALSGFKDIEVPVFGEKLAFLATELKTETDEKRFQRVIELVGLPQIDNKIHLKINARTLIKIRETTEAKEFRYWLAKMDGLSELEIQKQVHSVSNTIGSLVGGKAGKNIRFLITNGIGFVPVIGPIISTPLSLLDHFVLDKIFPRSGVTAFIDEMYPSIFDSKSL